MLTIIIAIGSLVGLILAGLFLISVFNKFVSNKNIVKDAFSNIDVFLKKRHDLIPNLVNTVKGYAEHEKDTLERVIQARNQAINVSSSTDINARIAAENTLQQALRSIFALSEAYPNLKADASFINFQNELSQLEEEISRSRKYYNATVRDNNTYGESFPAVLFKNIFGYQHFDFFEANTEERENVTVDFSKSEDKNQ
ncbi:MAG: LemA family protein [Chitinophagales bacterium]|nr:LemA family protein [Bacteroidota bacterium]